MNKAIIRARLETSTHGGHCSGNECEYESEIINHMVDVPEEYMDHPLGYIENIEEYFWEDLLPTHDFSGGSGYCCTGPGVTEHGLGTHDYRYTVISVNIVPEEYVYTDSESETEF
jgi:hypothetical protein